MKFKPFVVIDRPNLLIPASWIHREIPIGFMSHTYASENFAKDWHQLDCDKICDSGVFLKSNYQRNLTYSQLMARYEAMSCDYGIILDVLGDKDATIQSAEKGMSVYKQGDYTFQLIGVAQGKTSAEYVDCVKQLVNLGFNHIAIGGLLQKVENTARYVRVKSEDRMREIFDEVRKVWTGWLFSLGTYHPRRIAIFEDYDIYGSDSKRWAFRCEAGLETSERHRQVYTNFLKDLRKYHKSFEDLELHHKPSENLEEPSEQLLLFDGKINGQF